MSKTLIRTVALVVISISLLWADRQPAHGQQRVSSVAKPTHASCQRSGFRVVVDVGHTVEVPGADSARGVPEYAFNLRLADEIEQALLDAGFAKAVRLITATAPWQGLVERADRANKMHADLFISIHHDSVPDYLIETWDYEGQQHQFSDRFTGYAIFISNDNADRQGSLQFGGLLGKELQARGLHYTPHYTLPLMGKYRHALLDPAAGVYRYDQLIVLRHTEMPAVLLEAGSIVNRQEELELATPERRALTSAAVAAAVEDFCAARANVQNVKRLPAPNATAAPRRANPVSLSHTDNRPTRKIQRPGNKPRHSSIYSSEAALDWLRGDRQMREFDGEDGLNRRKVLECMTWVGTGVLWTISGGVPHSPGLIDTAVAQEARGLTFLQISDSHVGFDKPANPNALGTLEEAVHRINALPVKPAFMIHTGDISHLSKPSQFDDADRIISQTRLDVHYVPGEHDFLDEERKLYRERYGRGSNGAGWYSFDANGVHFIGLVNVVDLKAGGLGNLGNEQLEWLEADVKGRSASAPIVVFAHIPLWTVYPEWGWGTDDGGRALELLKGFGSVTVLNGHIHQVMQKVEGNVTFHTARSTAFPQPAPGTAPSPGPLKVADDKLRTLLGTASITFRRGAERLAIVDTALQS